jgi:uncharacterized protein (TIRG00374 family)
MPNGGGAWWLRLTLMICVLAASVLVFVLQVDVREFAITFGDASIGLLVFSGLSLGAFYYLRAVRWSMILGNRIPPFTLFLYSSVGYLASLFLPFQAGELIKAGLVRARHEIPYFEVIASVGLERLLDMMCLVLLGVASLLMAVNLNSTVAGLVNGVEFAGVVIAILLALAAALLHKSDLIIVAVGRAAGWLPVSETGRQRLVGIAGDLLRGGGVLKDPWRALGTLLFSLVLWMANVASVVLIFRAFGNPLPISEVQLGFILVSLGLIIPLSPGYVGQYEMLWLFVFTALGAGSKAAVLAMGVLSHGLILGLIVVFGGVSIASLPPSSIRTVGKYLADQRARVRLNT